LKLLLDQNLSYKLVARLETLFPGTTQARPLGMAQATDTAIWQYAADHGFTIVTKDSDFYERSLIHGFPPKIIWLQCGVSFPEIRTC
jgi:predicted nuclease of predicted toxin-antitoxin system